ncbi:hypothetical protein AV650_28435 (plasmid) [Serratia fonticola]|nr:hypothetical protein AV650_28435 [Serratia fonticola]
MVLSPSFASDQKEKNGSNFLTIKLMSVQNRSGQINVREQAQVRETVDRFYTGKRQSNREESIGKTSVVCYQR